jgi:hypothetical protein
MKTKKQEQRKSGKCCLYKKKLGQKFELFLIRHYVLLLWEFTDPIVTNRKWALGAN